MALVLLVGSGLLLRSVERLYAVHPGFESGGLLTAGVSLGDQADRTRMVMSYQRALEEVARLPGVSSSGATSSLPIAATNITGATFSIESRPWSNREIPPVVMYEAVTAGYFETMRIPLIEGRTPVSADAEQERPVTWVNEIFARQFLDGHAVGERIRFGETWLEIVGVVGDIRASGLREDVRPTAYLPLSDSTAAPDVMHVVIRTTAAPATLVSGLRTAIDRVDPSAPLTAARTMEEVVATSLVQMSFTMTLLVSAAGVALVLAVVGLYGVLAYNVDQRRAEIGVRLALGAQPGDVRAMVMRQGLKIALVGVIVGTLAALALTRVVESLLFEVSERDPATFLAVALALVTVSTLATYLPASKAAGIEPLQALRDGS